MVRVVALIYSRRGMLPCRKIVWKYIERKNDKINTRWIWWLFTIAQKLESKWNTTFSLFKWKMSEKTLYVRAVIFSRWKLSKRKLVFHFFKPICNTSFRHLLPFLGEREWFLQICNDHIHDHNDVWPLTLWHSLPIWKTNLYAAK